VNILSIPQIVLSGDAFASAVAYIAGNRSDSYGRKRCDMSMLPYKTNVMLTSQPPNGENP
jgi:hypothetical protein